MSSGASSAVLNSAATGGAESTQAAITMLGTALDTHAQMMAMLLRNLQTVSAQDTGGSVNTYA